MRRISLKRSKTSGVAEEVGLSAVLQRPDGVRLLDGHATHGIEMGHRRQKLKKISRSIPPRSSRLKGDRRPVDVASVNVARSRNSREMSSLEGGLVIFVGAEVAAEARDQAGCDFLAHRHFRPRLRTGGGFDFEDVEAERPLESGRQRVGQESDGQRAGSDCQLLLLRRRQIRSWSY